MAQAYERPFRPVELSVESMRSFPLQSMIQQLRSERTYRDAGRDALTLVHGEGLTAVLTVARQGTTCDEHSYPAPTLMLGLLGSLSISSPSDGGERSLREGEVIGMAPNVGHAVTAKSDCAFLTVIGET